MMSDELLVQELIIAMFLKLSLDGYSKISLRNENVFQYASKMKMLFQDQFLSGDLFIKTLVSESYDEFKSFLMRRLVGNRLAFFNDRYDQLTMVATPYYVQEELHFLQDYQDLIMQGCSLLEETFTNDSPEIDWLLVKKYV
ncbi:MAG: hypothetical protein PUB18_05960 [bacterium]|nr:hypothetical protein [bacterium]